MQVGQYCVCWWGMDASVVFCFFLCVEPYTGSSAALRCSCVICSDVVKFELDHLCAAVFNNAQTWMLNVLRGRAGHTCEHFTLKNGVLKEVKFRIKSVALCTISHVYAQLQAWTFMFSRVSWNSCLCAGWKYNVPQHADGRWWPRMNSWSQLGRCIALIASIIIPIKTMNGMQYHSSLCGVHFH